MRGLRYSAWATSQTSPLGELRAGVSVSVSLVADIYADRLPTITRLYGTRNTAVTVSEPRVRQHQQRGRLLGPPQSTPINMLQFIGSSADGETSS